MSKHVMARGPTWRSWQLGVLGLIWMLAPRPAFAGVVAGARSTYPTVVADTGLNVSLQPNNSSTAPEQTSNLILSNTRLTPSCGGVLNAVCRAIAYGRVAALCWSAKPRHGRGSTARAPPREAPCFHNDGLRPDA
jgi:hypothetical protein